MKRNVQRRGDLSDERNVSAVRYDGLPTGAKREATVQRAQRLRRLLAAALAMMSFCKFAVGGNFPLVNLAPYYTQVVGAYPIEIQLYGNSQPYLVPFKYQPNSRIIGGAIEPLPWRENTYPVMGRLVNFAYSDPNDAARGYYMQTYRDGTCSTGATSISISRAPIQGTTTSVVRQYSNRGYPTSTPAYNDCSDMSVPLPILFSATDAVTFNAPARRRASDGAEYDASPMAVQRDGQPWETYYWGYLMGLVASESNWVDSGSSTATRLRENFVVPSTLNNFELAALPAPHIEDDVIEYVNHTDFPNQPGGQYFYAVLAADKTLLDSLPQWQRTGKSFKSGGYVSVCRLYGGKNGGPNTHFYSADDKECAALKAIPQLSYEGQTFAVNMPMPAKNAAQAVPGALRDCPVESRPLYRIYNNASNSNGRFVSNHRYLTERADVTAAVAQGWVDEGHVMCVPL